jgi:trehalose 6-phosphate synthase/phosphatase
MGRLARRDPARSPGGRRAEAPRGTPLRFRVPSTDVARRYYGGFSNGTPWPLLHSFPVYATYSAGDWAAYRQANGLFADRIADLARRGDTVWIHDYHLILLPALVRERLPDATIGFFLHVPFPPYDVFRLLPWSREALQGMLGADLIGFHTYDFVQAFLGSVRRLLGLDNEIGRIAHGRRVVQVDAFPMGVDFGRWSAAKPDPVVERGVARIRRLTRGEKLAVSISRLDYTKGILQELQAVQRFLERHPEWRGKFSFLLAVTPSRALVPQYRQLRRHVDELVGRINSRYGGLHAAPIHYLYRRLSFGDLLALYRASDIALVSPLRDGMNLVAKEYLAARTAAGLAMKSATPSLSMSRRNRNHEMTPGGRAPMRFATWRMRVSIVIVPFRTPRASTT